MCKVVRQEKQNIDKLDVVNVDNNEFKNMQIFYHMIGNKAKNDGIKKNF